jgi:ribonuclease I
MMSRLPIAVALLACCLMSVRSAPADARMPMPAPASHDDFDHYTLALTWQPGFCIDGSCLPDTPHAPPIGIHGLWASLPRSLADRGIVNRQWWSKGCDYFHHSDAAPSLPVSVRHDLDATMPHTKSDLLRHEYDKHVQCFGFDPTRFFQTELAMRDAVADSAFGHALVADRGREIGRADLIAGFADGFRARAPRALQLQCHADMSGRVVLTQLWITIRRDRVADFPAPGSLTDSPVPQDNCPERFAVPGW